MPDAFLALEQIRQILATLDTYQRQWVAEVVYEQTHDLLTLEEDEG